jgi:hypothetical protein
VLVELFSVPVIVRLSVVQPKTSPVPAAPAGTSPGGECWPDG